MAQDQPDVQGQLLRSLLKKVANDPYPSETMMDTVEELLTPDTLPAYAKVLLDKIENDQFPSTSMIDRVKQLGVG
jgi:hypothetical protein